MRETYFASQVGVGHKLSMPNQGDLIVDGKMAVRSRRKKQRIHTDKRY